MFEKKGRNPNLHLFLSAILLILARSLGGVWILCFIFLIYRICGPISQMRTLVWLSILGTALQYWLGNKNYPLGEGAWDPPWNFYLEEAVRVFNGSGDWLVSYFGTLSWSEIRLPLILIYVLLTSYIYLFVKATSQYQEQKQLLFFIFFGAWVLPFMLAVAFSKDWPGFWQGRYSLPFIMGIVIILVHRAEKFEYKYPLFFLFLSNVYLILLTFARFNWGLYGTNTPIISNGWSFSPEITSSFITVFTIYFISTLYFMKSQLVERKSKFPLA